MRELKLICLRESPGAIKPLLVEPQQAFRFWQESVTQASWFDPSKECLVVIFLNARLRVIGFHLVCVGLLNQVLIHPREIFRPAILAAAHSIVLMHNHPSGDASPSQDDLRSTRQLIEAGKIIGIELTDHVIIGQTWCSLRESGLFDPNQKAAAPS